MRAYREGPSGIRYTLRVLLAVVWWIVVAAAAVFAVYLMARRGTG